MTTAYDQSAAHREASERVILATFAHLGLPRSMLDLGCGPGAMCKIAARLGVDVLGIDEHIPDNEKESGRLIRGDFLCASYLTPRELVLCLEVAEHIPESGADELVGLLTRVTEKHLLFSAATPGQGGCGHVNEQPHDYWRAKIHKAGLGENIAMTGRLRRVFSEIAPEAWWYGQNVMLFEAQP